MKLQDLSLADLISLKQHITQPIDEEEISVEESFELLDKEDSILDEINRRIALIEF